MILVCGALTDIVSELMCARLNSLRYEYHLLDRSQYPDAYKLTWTFGVDGLTGSITAPDWHIDLGDVSGVFVRYVGTRAGSGARPGPDSLGTAAGLEHQEGLMALWERLPCIVANRASDAMSNHSKPYQSLLIRQGTLMIPRTLITNDARAVMEFYDECEGNVIFKSLSGMRSIVRRLERADFARFGNLAHGPAQFQTCIPGLDVRVHTVNDDVFATAIRSSAVDYHFADRQGGGAEMEPTDLPLAVAQACLDLARSMKLVIAGIDLKRTPDGEWYCFEVNPAPGFAYYEQHTGQPISAALAEVLRKGRG
jgi:hypothetical protein